MSKDDVEAKIEAAYERLEEGDAEVALALGRDLEELCHSSGFEVQALAHARLGDRREAIEVLERGVEEVSDVWLLWQLLGNYQSDEECFEDALAAYERALQCPHVDTLSVHYNIATVLSRQGRLASALDHLDLAHAGSDPSRELKLLVAAQRMSLLSRLERYEEALTEGRRLIAQARLEDTLDAEMAPVLGEYACALWRARGDREAAEQAALETIELDKTADTAMWVLRELNPDASAEGALYRLILVGRWDRPLTEGEEPPGFHSSYQVVADSEGEAFQLALPFEPAAVRGSLAIEEAEVVGPRPRWRKGVYWTSRGYNFFPGHELETEHDT